MQSLYAVINDRGIRQFSSPVMWIIPVPSRLHIFLWLLANNKILTKENLPKTRKVENMSCLFCNERRKHQVICFFIVVLPRFFGKTLLRYVVGP
jgi:hypothetical protein